MIRLRSPPRHLVYCHLLVQLRPFVPFRDGSTSFRDFDATKHSHPMSWDGPWPLPAARRVLSVSRPSVFPMTLDSVRDAMNNSQCRSHDGCRDSLAHGPDGRHVGCHAKGSRYRWGTGRSLIRLREDFVITDPDVGSSRYTRPLRLECQEQVTNRPQPSLNGLRPRLITLLTKPWRSCRVWTAMPKAWPRGVSAPLPCISRQSHPQAVAGQMNAGSSD